MRLIGVTVLLGVALLLSGCSRDYDLYFANPCDHALSVETYSSPPDRIDKLPASAIAEIPRLSVRLIEHAFVNSYGLEWTILVDGKTKVPVKGDRFPNDTVVLTASVC